MWMWTQHVSVTLAPMNTWASTHVVLISLPSHKGATQRGAVRNLEMPAGTTDILLSSSNTE